MLLPICLKPSGQQRQFRGTLKTLRSHTYSSAKVTGQITIIVGSRYLAISWENSGVLAESLQPESQCGYRTKRGTVDMTFAVKKLQEKCWEQHQDLYLIFADLTNAFDSVSRCGHWKILKRTGCPDKLVNILRSFHEGIQARVINGNQESAPF